MKLGLANHKVDVVKHDPAWRQEFVDIVRYSSSVDCIAR
ncbi:hypothetical protein VCHENC02_4855 [Vibrio harveyi]|uniref:Uncharacterized protein n=1 Tax=Vibrio harveyi TaxID=669 RepID=A0A454CSF4_VIBHA|nr:hypothetical protein VCHENC02_4855 [Vibrio harveyi]